MIEEETFQQVLETFISDRRIPDLFSPGGVAGNMIEKCLWQKIKDVICLVSSVNSVRRGNVTTDWAMLNFDEVFLMFNAAALTCLRTLLAFTTFDDSLLRTSDLVTNSGSDNEKERSRNAAQHEEIVYEDIGLQSKHGDSRSNLSYRGTLVLISFVFF